MRAVVYHGPGDKRLEEVPDPELINDTDGLVAIDLTTICGTDLHILNGEMPEVTPGRVLGHEGVGTVMDVGARVSRLEQGDRVVLSSISACGVCRYCWIGHFGQCLHGGGWVLGRTVDGLQAELARIPFIQTSAYKIPRDMTDEQALYLSEVLPAGYELGALRGAVQPGNVVVIVGAGPLGLSTVLGVRVQAPATVIAVDPIDSRRVHAAAFGAQRVTSPEGAKEAVDELTEGLGADLAVEAVGHPESFELCIELIRPGGRVANIGSHGRPVPLHLESLWSKSLTIATGLVDTNTIPILLWKVEGGLIDPTPLSTHRFAFDQAMAAYDTFARPEETGALKVVLRVPARDPTNER